MYVLGLLGIGGLAWLVLRKPQAAPANGRVFGNPSANDRAQAMAAVGATNGLAIANDCSWVVEGAGFLPPRGSDRYVRPIAVASGVLDSVQAYGSAWGFVMQLLGSGMTPAQAAEVIIAEAPVELTVDAQHCGTVTALSPAMVAWRASLTERIAAWQTAEKATA